MAAAERLRWSRPNVLITFSLETATIVRFTRSEGYCFFTIQTGAIPLRENQRDSGLVEWREFAGTLSLAEA